MAGRALLTPPFAIMDSQAHGAPRRLSAGLREATNRLAEDAAKWQKWVELVLAISAEPAVVDMAEHILYIGRTSLDIKG